MAEWTRGLLHLLVGGACATLVGWLAFGFTISLRRADGSLFWATAVLTVLAVAVAVALLLAPPVRAAEVALARSLLGVALRDPADTSSWDSRGRGLLWAGLVIGIGGVALVALLWCTPQGIWMIVAAASPTVRESLSVVDGWPGPLLALAGLTLVAAGVLLQPVLVILLRLLAPLVLGPTPGDRLAWAEESRARLLRGNTLARELHDSIGHSLSAIGVQAEAAVRVADQDPEFTRTALERIAKTTRQAVGELDEVLGVLREGDAPRAQDRARSGTHPASLRPVLDLVGEGTDVACEEAAGEVDDEAVRTAYRLVQEGLTNARRHGGGPPRGHVRVRAGRVEILLENEGGPARGRAGGGRGLTGARERTELVGGTVQAGPFEVSGMPWWRFAADLPARSGNGHARRPAGGQSEDGAR